MSPDDGAPAQHLLPDPSRATGASTDRLVGDGGHHKRGASVAASMLRLRAKAERDAARDLPHETIFRDSS